MTAVVDRVACPECGAQKGEGCMERREHMIRLWDQAKRRVLHAVQPHQARREAYAASRRPVADTVAEAEEK